jgi:PilZ domain
MIYKREEAYRYTFPNPVPCSFSIVGVEHIRINTGKGEGELIDISPSGCKMSTLFDIPVDQKVRVQMEFTLHTERLVVQGILVWQRIQGEGFHYGVEFTGDENLGTSITEDLKQLVKQH